MSASLLDNTLKAYNSLQLEVPDPSKISAFAEQLFKLSQSPSMEYLEGLAKKIKDHPSPQLLKDAGLALERHAYGTPLYINQKDKLQTKSQNSELIIALENIRSAVNIGAILRSGSFFGVKEFIGIGYTASPKHPKVIKTSMQGFGENNQDLPWQQYETSSEFIENISSRHPEHQLVAVETTKDAIIMEDYHFAKKTILIFGNEVHGINQTTLQYAKHHIALQSNGYKNSLNVATCMGICTYAYSASTRGLH